MTGSFFDAMREGMMPAMRLRPMLTTISPSPQIGSFAKTAISVNIGMIRLIIPTQTSVIAIPITPDAKPRMTVSALKTLDTLRFDAPTAQG